MKCWNAPMAAQLLRAIPALIMYQKVVAISLFSIPMTNGLLITSPTPGKHWSRGSISISPITISSDKALEPLKELDGSSPRLIRKSETVPPFTPIKAT